MTYSEVDSFQGRFDMIESYEIRYRGTMALFSNAKVYDACTSSENLYSYNIAYYQVTVLMNDIFSTNVDTRKNFAGSNLDYDSYPVLIEDHGQTISYTFSHAIIRVYIIALLLYSL